MKVQPSGDTTAGNLSPNPNFALLGLAVNVAFAVIKIAAGVVGHAYALSADGIESALHVGGSIIIWAGLCYAARPPDAGHPYGHGKAKPLAAMLFR